MRVAKEVVVRDVLGVGAGIRKDQHVAHSYRGHRSVEGEQVLACAQLTDHVNGGIAQFRPGPGIWPALNRQDLKQVAVPLRTRRTKMMCVAACDHIVAAECLLEVEHLYGVIAAGCRDIAATFEAQARQA